MSILILCQKLLIWTYDRHFWWPAPFRDSAPSPLAPHTTTLVNRASKSRSYRVCVCVCVCVNCSVVHRRRYKLLSSWSHKSFLHLRGCPVARTQRRRRICEFICYTVLNKKLCRCWHSATCEPLDAWLSCLSAKLHIFHTLLAFLSRIWITGYYNLSRLWHAESQDIELSCLSLPMSLLVAQCHHNQPS